MFVRLRQYIAIELLHPIAPALADRVYPWKALGWE